MVSTNTRNLIPSFWRNETFVSEKKRLFISSMCVFNILHDKGKPELLKNGLDCIFLCVVQNPIFESKYFLIGSNIEIFFNKTISVNFFYGISLVGLRPFCNILVRMQDLCSKPFC